MAVGMRQANHASVNILYMVLPKKKWIEIVHLVIYTVSALVFFSLLSYWNYGMTMRQLRSGEISPALEIPMFLVSLPLFICDLLAVIGVSSEHVAGYEDKRASIFLRSGRGFRYDRGGKDMSVFLLIVFFILSFLGIPLAISLGLASIGTVLIYGLPITIIARLMYTSMNSFLLVAVPLFILAGTVMEKGGVADRIFAAAKSYVGRFRGGLGMVNIIASFIFGGISGSSVADVGSLGPLEIKAMTDEGYEKSYSAALTMVTSTLSSVVPPSILMIIAAVAAGQSVGACLAGGFGPALTISGIFMIQNYLIARRRGYGIRVKRSFREIVGIMIGSLPALFSPVIILFGMFSGFVTPTEAAAIAVLYTLLVSSLVYKKMPWKEFPRMVIGAGITSGTILLVAMTASVATYIFAVDQLPMKVSALMLGLSQSPALIMVLMGFIFIIVGMFLDITAAILLLTPVLMPTAVQVGVNPVHFVVFMVTALSIGLSTPPVGVCLFATSLVSHTSIEKIVKASWQFYVTMFLFISVFAMTPQISLIFVRLFT